MCFPFSPEISCSSFFNIKINLMVIYFLTASNKFVLIFFFSGSITKRIKVFGERNAANTKS